MIIFGNFCLKISAEMIINAKVQNPVQWKLFICHSALPVKLFTVIDSGAGVFCTPVFKKDNSSWKSWNAETSYVTLQTAGVNEGSHKWGKEKR